MPVFPYSPERTIRFIFGYYFVTERDFLEYIDKVRALPGNSDLEFFIKDRYRVKGLWILSYKSNINLYRPIPVEQK